MIIGLFRFYSQLLTLYDLETRTLRYIFVKTTPTSETI